MTSSDDNTNAVREDLYQQSYADLEELKQQLPEKAFVSFAHEVLGRLAHQLREAETVPSNIDDLVDALLSPDPKHAANYITALANRGDDLNAIYLDYLGPAAVQLGEEWNRDKMTFGDVTIGIARIYAIMRTLRSEIPRPSLDTPKSALFASVPGDDHTLGVKMAADLARKDEWQIQLVVGQDHEKLVETITTSGILLIGLSGSGEHSVPNLARLVVALRISTPDALIMVSGHVVDVAEDRVKLMHVDAIHGDYVSAMEGLEKLRRSLIGAHG